MGTRQEANGEGKIGLACSTKVKGCVFAVAEVAGRLFAAINESVSVVSHFWIYCLLCGLTRYMSSKSDHLSNRRQYLQVQLEFNW